MKTKLHNIYNQREKLCVNCIYGKSTKSGTVYCHKTSKVPNFDFFCPDFKIHTESEFRAERLLKIKKIDLIITQSDIDEKTNTFVLVFFVIAVSIFGIFGTILNSLSPHGKEIFGIILAIVVVIVIVSSIIIANNKLKFYRLLMPNPFSGKFTHLPYYYLVLSLHLYSKKGKHSTEDLRIIEQTIIRVFGQRYLKYAKYFISYGTKGEINGKYFRKYALKIDYKFRILLFMLSAELCVHNNIEKFRNSEVLKIIAFILDIQPEHYTQIKKDIEIKEFEYHKKIEEQKRQEEAERKRQRRQKSYRIFSIVKKDYYSILGLKSNASISEIKSKFRKLAIKFHPDKYINNSTEQKEASKKFKKYSEAYNHLKRKKGF